MTALDFISYRESGSPPAQISLWRERRAAGQKRYVLLGVCSACEELTHMLVSIMF